MQCGTENNPLRPPRLTWNCICYCAFFLYVFYRRTFLCFTKELQSTVVEVSQHILDVLMSRWQFWALSAAADLLCKMWSAIGYGHFSFKLLGLMLEMKEVVRSSSLTLTSLNLLSSHATPLTKSFMLWETIGVFPRAQALIACSPTQHKCQLSGLAM